MNANSRTGETRNGTRSLIKLSASGGLEISQSSSDFFGVFARIWVAARLLKAEGSSDLAISNQTTTRICSLNSFNPWLISPEGSSHNCTASF